MKGYQQLFINGRWVSPLESEVFEVINPATDEAAAKITLGGASDVDRAVKAARNALPNWSQNGKRRVDMISALAEVLWNRREQLADVISETLGMPRHLVVDYQIEEPVNILAGYADRVALMDEVEERDNSLIVKMPVGVCGLISPWNYPLNQLIGKMAPALAAGCTMVVKPSEQTSLQDYMVAEACQEIGLPDGVFNLVTGRGETVGAAIASHDDIDMVSFTGSTRAGVQVAQAAAPTVKRVVQELGGKSPLIVTADADLQEAIEYGVEDVMANSGQTCTAYTRMLLPRSCRETAIDLIRAAVSELKVGSGDHAFIGPLISRAQQQRVQRYIQTGIDEGATLVIGGVEPPEGYERGCYVQPTVFADVNADMVIAREEIFGPVICMMFYDTLDEAVQLANDSVYGLSSAVYAADREQGLAIAKRIEAGTVFVNGGDYNINAPFGGIKQSGNGREFGVEGMIEYYEIKSIQL